MADVKMLAGRAASIGIVRLKRHAKAGFAKVGE